MTDQVVRSAESCAKTLAAVLSLNKLVRILKHAISDNYPENYTAIKTLTRLVEQRPKEDTVQILPEMMPALLRTTDHTESIVRKVRTTQQQHQQHQQHQHRRRQLMVYLDVQAAVFCIVEIYKRAPDELKPYLESLNSSKMKLINVYIQRAGQVSLDDHCDLPLRPRTNEPMAARGPPPPPPQKKKTKKNGNDRR